MCFILEQFQICRKVAKIYREFLYHVPTFPVGNRLRYYGTSVTTEEPTCFITKLNSMLYLDLVSFSLTCFFCSRTSLRIQSLCLILLWPVRFSSFLMSWRASRGTGILQSSADPPSHGFPLLLCLTPAPLTLHFLGKGQHASFCLWIWLLGNLG